MSPAVSTRNELIASVFLLALILAFVVIEWPGVSWLVGYGQSQDQSFNPDDNRFVGAVKNFELFQDANGYPVFMTAQAFVLSKIAKLIINGDYNVIILLRNITLSYAILSILMTSIICRLLHISILTSLLACLFVVCAPLFVLLSYQGTPDVSAVFLFYFTILLSILHRKFNSIWCFYGACLLAGVTMADKFYLPVLVAPALLIAIGAKKGLLERAFLALCIGLTAFCAASFFNYTPWDFGRLLRMLVEDNLVVAEGRTPLQQAVMYGWELPAAVGIVPSAIALLTSVAFLWRTARTRARAGVGPVRPAWLSRGWGWLGGVGAVVALPLLAAAFLLMTAQVHAIRHLLVFVPLVCVVAAIGVGSLQQRLSASRIGRSVQAPAALVLTAGLLYNSVLTNRIYTTDVRMAVVEFLEQSRPGARVETLSYYTALRGVSQVAGPPQAPVFITCSLEYLRFLRSNDARRVFHARGGQLRLDFYHALLADRTDYRLTRRIERDRFSLEDQLAGAGWLPDLGTFAPHHCLVFDRRT